MTTFIANREKRRRAPHSKISRNPGAPHPRGRVRECGALRCLRLLAFLFALLPVVAHAQRVYWDPGHGTLGFGKYSELNLVFDDCTPAGEVALPAATGIEFTQPTISQHTSINFGQRSSRMIYSYQVQPTSRAGVVIPAFDAPTNHGKIAVGEVRFTVGDATVGQSGVNVSEILSGVLRPARATVWAGEVFDVEYQLLVSPRFPPRGATPPEWKPPGVFAEPFGEKFEPLDAMIGSERRIGARFRTRASATTAGDLQLAPVTQTINIQTGERSGFMLSQPRVESFNLTSDEPTITVRPLPAPMPPGFTGAVGDFKLESKVVPQIARVGEPITWTVTLRGTGNWPANPTLPEREISADFQVVQPQERKVMDDGRLFSGSITEDAVLVPTRAGTYTIGPIPFTWFDTNAGRFREEPIPAVTVTIQAPAAPASLTAPDTHDAGVPDEAGTQTEVTRPLPSDLTAPGQLPREPLPLGDTAAVPGNVGWWWWFPLALALPALVWLALAWWTMVRTDRHVARQKARRALLRLLAPHARAQVAPDRALIETWRTLTAQLWLIERATPTVDDLAAALQNHRGAPRPDDWLQLWRESDDALFAAGQALPADWSTRAWQTAGAARVHRDGLPAPLKARYWMPGVPIVVVALLLGAFGAAPGRAADAGRRAYDAGDFAAARTVWRIAVTNQPRDWAARNNLALACAQQNDWPEAAAHWTAAFLLNPREPSVRANLRLALTHLDGVDPELRRIVEGSWLDRWITALSPAEWQRLFVGGGIVVALALTLLVTTLYTPSGRRWRTRTGLILVPAGVLVSIAGMSGKVLYGPLGEAGAGLVAKATELRSIPTELTEQQQMSPLSAGAVVVSQRSFLNWERVDVARSGGGWVRNETVVPFFAAPPKAADGEKL